MKNDPNMLEMDLAIQKIKEEDKIALICHINPDADALGSTAAMYLMLKECGKDVVWIQNDSVAGKYDFITRYVEKEGWVQVEEKDRIKGRLLVSIDCGDKERHGDFQTDLCPFVIDIDHHASGQPFGDINIIDPSASASGEIVFRLFAAWGRDLTKEIAFCLYSAISADTGNFKFSNVTKDTFLIASKLKEVGFDHTVVPKILFDEMDQKSAKLLGYILSNYHSEQDTLIWISVDHDFITKHQLSGPDFDGLVSYLLRIVPHKVAVLFREMEKDVANLSFRSEEDRFDVGELASRFHGGGHKRAAGAVIEGKLDQTISMVLSEIRDMIK